MNSLRATLALTIALLVSPFAAAWARAPSLAPAPKEALTIIDVWPGAAPGATRLAGPEQVTDLKAGPLSYSVVRNVVRPTLTVFPADPRIATGAAAIIAPGGGFRYLSIESEGYQVARWLAAHGVTAIVLKYRTLQTPADDAAFAQSMQALRASRTLSDLDAESRDAVADGAQAIDTVRAHAGEWGFDPARLGFIGFSAGGRLVSGLLLRPQPPALAFAAPIYGGPFGHIDPVPPQLPPVFLAVAQDDGLARDPVLRFEAALRAAGHKPELHLYASGGHGFGMNPQGKPSDHWIDAFWNWLQATGVTKTAGR